MRKLLMLVLLAMHAVLWSPAASAAPCTTSSLASYVGLGATGCTIGTFRFSDFGLLQQPTGSVPFAAVTVTPVVVGTTSIGLDFGVDSTAAAGQLFDDLIRYRVTGVGGTVGGASLFIVGSRTTDDASVTAVENLCLGGGFLGADGVSGCSGIAQTLIVVNVFGVEDPPASLAFLPVAALAVVTDIGVDGGTGGSGFLASVGNRFTVLAGPNAVPEPGSVLLLAIGAFVCASLRRRFRRT